MANSIECINCDAVVDLTGLTMPVDGLILRCPSCKSKLRAMPTGVVTLHSTSNPMSAGPSGSAAFGSGSSARPVAAAAYGADLPNLSILQSPGSAWAGRVATVEQLDFPRLVLGSVFRHKYRIDGEIGQGGSAVVYRAHDLDAEMDVALKVVGVASSNSKLRTMATGYPTKWCQRFSTHSSRLGRLAKPPAWGCPSFARSFFRIAEISKCEQQKV